MPAVTENSQSSSNEETEYPIENYVGNVYIGSPQRRRHYLEPLNVCKKTPSPKGKDRKKTVWNYFFQLNIFLNIYMKLKSNIKSQISLLVRV